MKMTHVVKYRSGSIVRHRFKTKAESDKAFKNAIQLNSTFKTISIIQVMPTNNPSKVETYYF